MDKSLNLTRGLLNSVLYHGHDNLIETYYDSYLLRTFFLRKSGYSSMRGSSTLDFIYQALPESVNVLTSFTNLTNQLLINKSSGSLGTNQGLGVSSYDALFQYRDRVGDLVGLYNPVLFKFLFWDRLFQGFNVQAYLKLLKSQSQLNVNLTNFPLLKTNLIPLSLFKYTIRRKIIKLVVSSKYLPRTTVYFYRTLVHFMEFYTGKKVYIKLNPFIENSLTYSDLARCYM